MPFSPKHFKVYSKVMRSHWNGEQKFRLSKIPNPVYNIPLIVLPITKYSPLFDIFNPMVLRLTAGGIVEQLAKFYYLDFIKEKDEAGLQKISFGHMLTGTYGYIIGLVLSALVFIIEKKVMYRKVKVDRNNNKKWV